MCNYSWNCISKFCFSEIGEILDISVFKWSTSSNFKSSSSFVSLMNDKGGGRSETFLIAIRNISISFVSQRVIIVVILNCFRMVIIRQIVKELGLEKHMLYSMITNQNNLIIIIPHGDRAFQIKETILIWTQCHNQHRKPAYIMDQAISPFFLSSTNLAISAG